VFSLRPKTRVSTTSTTVHLIFFMLCYF
jgi:hypothetical protein